MEEGYPFDAEERNKADGNPSRSIYFGARGCTWHTTFWAN